MLDTRVACPHKAADQRNGGRVAAAEQRLTKGFQVGAAEIQVTEETVQVGEEEVQVAEEEVQVAEEEVQVMADQQMGQNGHGRQ